MKLFVLDTNAYIAYSRGDKKFFSPLVMRFIKMVDEVECRFYIPTVSFWEITTKVLNNKLNFGKSSQEEILNLMHKPLENQEKFRDLSLTRKAASLAPTFRNILPDPFDQLIVASAIEANLPLITKDKNIQESKLIRTVW